MSPTPTHGPAVIPRLRGVRRAPRRSPLPPSTSGAGRDAEVRLQWRDVCHLNAAGIVPYQRIVAVGARPATVDAERGVVVYRIAHDARAEGADASGAVFRDDVSLNDARHVGADASGLVSSDDVVGQREEASHRDAVMAV